MGNRSTSTPLWSSGLFMSGYTSWKSEVDGMVPKGRSGSFTSMVVPDHISIGFRRSFRLQHHDNLQLTTCVIRFAFLPLTSLYSPYAAGWDPESVGIWPFLTPPRHQAPSRASSSGVLGVEEAPWGVDGHGESPMAGRGIGLRAPEGGTRDSP